MLVVHEDEEHPPGFVSRRTWGRQQDALGDRRSSGRGGVIGAPSVGHGKRHELLGYAVLQDLEIVDLQVRQKLVVLVANHHIRGDEFYARVKSGLALILLLSFER